MHPDTIASSSQVRQPTLPEILRLTVNHLTGNHTDIHSISARIDKSEFARAMRSPEGRASAELPPPAAAEKAPCSKTQGRQPKAQARSPAATEVIGDRSKLTTIAEQVRNARRVALDIETYGERRGDGLDPWKGDIRLLSLCVENQQPWIIDLRAIGYDLGELKTALESVEIIAHNAKFDLLWLRVKCGLRATRVFCTLVAARLLVAGTKPGNDLDDWLSYFSVVFKGCLRDAERLRDGFCCAHPRASHRRARGPFTDQCGLCALSPAQHGQHLIYRLLVHRLNVECPKEQVPLKV